MKKSIALLFSIALFVSCATTKYSSPRGVNIGMTKEQVAALTGKSCKLVGATKSPEGMYETMEYIKREKGMNDELFVYYFFNNKLTEWHTEVLEPKRAAKPRSKPDTSNRRP